MEAPMLNWRTTHPGASQAMQALGRLSPTGIWLIEIDQTRMAASVLDTFPHLYFIP